MNHKAPTAVIASAQQNRRLPLDDTADFADADRGFIAALTPCVVKADGIAAGKGVFVCYTAAELDEALRAVTSLGGGVLIEELLEGDEVSLFALSDGRRLLEVDSWAKIGEQAEGHDDGPEEAGVAHARPGDREPGRRRERDRRQQKEAPRIVEARHRGRDEVIRRRPRA